MGHLIFHAGAKGKANRANSKGMTRHIQRKTKGTENHSNKDIKKDLTEYNIDLKVNGKTADEVIEDRLENEYKGKRKLRKDHVVLRDVVTQPSPEMFEGMSIVEKQKMMSDFMKDALPWFFDEFGRENIVGASAHLDEKNPHAHIMVMPMKDGKVSQTEFFKSPGDLRRQHAEYRKHMIAKGWDFEQGNKYEEIDNHDMPVFKANAKNIQADRAAQTKALRDARIDLSESPEVRKEALNMAFDAVIDGVIKSERERLEKDEERLKTEREQFEDDKAKLDAERLALIEEKKKVDETKAVVAAVTIGVLKNDPKRSHLCEQIEKYGISSFVYKGEFDSVLITNALVASLEDGNAAKRPTEGAKFVHQKAVEIQTTDDGPEL